MEDRLRSAVRAALGRPVRSAEPLTGGCISRVYRVCTEGGPDVVVKVSGGGEPTLAVEAFMLGYLKGRTGLPVPSVLHAGGELLIVEFVPGASEFDPPAQRHAADLLAELHGHSAEAFGFECDTVIGPLPQANPWTASWAEFFARQRLRIRADEAAEGGMITVALRDRVRRVADACPRLLREPEAPALVHGDVWGGNVLAAGGRVTAFLDPALYFGHPEVELAFIALFGTFGRAFFDRYGERRPIEAGFFESRAAVYNLYPLLVHARLFGGVYPIMIERSVAGLGF